MERMNEGVSRYLELNYIMTRGASRAAALALSKCRADHGWWRADAGR